MIDIAEKQSVWIFWNFGVGKESLWPREWKPVPVCCRLQCVAALKHVVVSVHATKETVSYLFASVLHNNPIVKLIQFCWSLALVDFDCTKISGCLTVAINVF